MSGVQSWKFPLGFLSLPQISEELLQQMSVLILLVFLLKNDIAGTRKNVTVARQSPRTEEDSGVQLSGRTTYEDIFPPDYEKYEAPVVDDQAVRIYLKLSVMDVDNINEESMDFSIQMYLTEMWKDPRLNLSGFISNFSVIFPPNFWEHIWKPDLSFDNAKSGELFSLSVPNTGVRVLQGGEFFRSSRYNMKVGCQMVLRFYPMDTQHCFLKTALCNGFFTSFEVSSPDHKAELHWIAEEESPYRQNFPKSITFTQNVEPLKYDLLHPLPHKEKECWPSGNYTYLYANFTFVRRLSGSLVNMYIPSTLVVVLSWLSFWIDVTAVPARITLGVTSLLTLATQVVQARGLLPPVNYMTALDVWLLVCMLMVFSSIIEFAVAYHLNFLNREVNEVEPSHRVSASVDILRTKSTKEVQGKKKMNTFMANRRHSTQPRDEGPIHQLKSIFKEVKDSLQKTSVLDSVCRKLFPFAFLSFAAFYWVYYLNIKT